MVRVRVMDTAMEVTEIAEVRPGRTKFHLVLLEVGASLVAVVRA